jgi:hypothetical protein
MTTDIFHTDFQFPETVSILAPGPVPDGTWDRMSGYVVAVNKAIEVPMPFGIDMWVVGDWWSVHSAWFDAQEVEDINPSIIKCFSHNLFTVCGVADLTFRFRKEIVSERYRPLPGMFRPDGTVSGIAIEMAARFGAKTIELCGMPFGGKDWVYFDGTRSPNFGENIKEGSEHFWSARQNRAQYQERWIYTDYLDDLIGWVRRRGIEIYSLNETALKVEVRS